MLSLVKPVQLHASLADSLEPSAIQRVYRVGDIMASLEEAPTASYPAGAVIHALKITCQH